MLNNEHFKILEYEPNANAVFPTTTITGGIAISLQSRNRIFDTIEVFTQFNELNSILQKIIPICKLNNLSEIAISSYSYHFTEQLHNDHPEILKAYVIDNGVKKPLISKGHEYDLKSNIFDKLPQIFLENVPSDDDYYKVLGRSNNSRVWRFILKKYIQSIKNTDKYKVVFSGADGAAGQLGNPVPARIIGNTTVVMPNVCSTESFMSVGSFETIEEAKACEKYLNGKFTRALVGVAKVTQNITPEKFKYVPSQDFTDNSDIDWSKSIAEIDHQLYKKYGLSKEEIDFIETHVKEMA